MSFDGNEGKAIHLSVAAQYTQNYREATAGDPAVILSSFFGRKILLQLLAQSGCEGIRFYYGLNGTVPEMVAVGADNEEADQLGANCIIADDAPKGPPCSGPPSPLNTTQILQEK